MAFIDGDNGDNFMAVMGFSQCATEPKSKEEQNMITEDYCSYENDKETFGMELDEPMCKTKVAREGIVLRIDDDPVKEAFKLKTVKFREREKSLIDNGEVDMEMMDAYIS